jgi:hypothetical protein
MPAALPSTATSITVWPSLRSSSARSRSGAGSMESPLNSSALPTATCLPDTDPVTPLPVTELNPATSPKERLLYLRAVSRWLPPEDVRWSVQGWRRVATGRIHQSRLGNDRTQRRLPFCEGSRFVDDQCVDFAEDFERLRIANEDAGASPAAGAHHDRHGRGKPKSAWASDNQYSDSVHKGMSEAGLRTDEEPHCEGDRRSNDHSRYKVRRHSIRLAAGSALATAAPR